MSRPRRKLPWTEVHANGTHYVFWYDSDLRRTCKESLGTRNDAEAKTAFARFLTTGPKNTRLVGPAGVTVRQVLDWYDTQHVEPNVVDKNRQRDAIAHLLAFMADTPIAHVDVELSRAYATARRSGKIGGGERRKVAPGSDSTIRRELNVLIAAANHAKKWDRITAAELPRVELPTDVRSDTVKWLTKDELQTVLRVADGRLRDFILIAYYTAARRRSIENMAKGQVDLRHGVINLQPEGGVETKKRRPKVPIFPEIRPTIERLMDEPGDELIGRDMYRWFCELMDLLKLDVSPHCLRHSRATHMLMDGEDPYKVAKLLGDTLATVERVYAHATTGYLMTKSTLEVA